MSTIPAAPPPRSSPASSVASFDKADVPSDARSYTSEKRDANVVVFDAIDSHSSPGDQRLVLKKLDRYLMPMLCVTYFLQYIDKSALAYSAVFNLKKDLGLVGNQYALLGSLFYIGYLVAEFPASYALQRLGVRWFVPIMIIVWGSILAATSAGRDFSQFAALRILLGLAEAVVTPAFLLITGSYYKKEEQPFRAGIWYCMNGLGALTGSLISYGCGQIHYKSYPVWSWIYLLTGCLTVLWGVVLLFILPSSPMTAWFLTPDERVIAIERLKSNQTSLGSSKVNWSQVREVFDPRLDPQGWLLFIWITANEVVNGSSTFLHLVTQDYGFDALKTSLLGMPTGFMQIVFILSGSFIARRYKGVRIWVMIGYLAPSLLGLILQLAVPRTAKPALLFGNYLLGSYVTSLVIGLSMPSANAAGYTKRIAMTAFVFLGYCVGNVCGPQAFFTGEKIPYMTGFVVCLVMNAVQVVTLLILRAHYVRQNKLRDRLQAEREAKGETLPKHDVFADLTDTQNLDFRYQL